MQSTYHYFKKRRDYVRILKRDRITDVDPKDPDNTLDTVGYLVEWEDGTSSLVPVRQFKRSGPEAKAMAAEYERTHAPLADGPKGLSSLSAQSGDLAVGSENGSKGEKEGKMREKAENEEMKEKTEE